MLLLVCTRAENSPNPYPSGMAPAPSSRNLCCPILMDADSLEMAKIDLWCPANDVHLQDLLKETAEMSDLQNDGISGFRSLAIKGSHWCTGRGKTILLLPVLPPLHLSEKMGHFVLFQKQNGKKSFFFFSLPNFRLLSALKCWTPNGEHKFPLLTASPAALISHAGREPLLSTPSPKKELNPTYAYVTTESKHRCEVTEILLTENSS